MRVVVGRIGRAHGIRGDVAVEAMVRVLRHGVAAIVALLRCLRRGPAATKTWLTRRLPPDAATLPYRDEVLALIAGQALVEVADWHLQNLGQLPEACSRHAVGGAFVLLDLLEAHAARLCELLLGQAQQAAAAAQAAAKMGVNLVHGCPGHRVQASRSGTPWLRGRNSHASRLHCPK